MANALHFNVNDTVRVRLTSVGEARHTRNMESLQSQLPWIDLGDVHPADADGWREFQLWELMQHFGAVMFCGSDAPFVDNVIEIRVPANEAANA